MRALVLEEFGGPFKLQNMAVPRIHSQEALLRVRSVGLCETDLKIRAWLVTSQVLMYIRHGVETPVGNAAQLALTSWMRK